MYLFYKHIARYTEIKKSQERLYLLGYLVRRNNGTVFLKLHWGKQLVDWDTHNELQ